MRFGLAVSIATACLLSAAAGHAAPTSSPFQQIDLPVRAAISVNSVALGYDGKTSMLFWTDSGDLFATRQASGGTVVPGGSVIESPFGSGSLVDPVTVWSGGLHWVAYRDGDDVILLRVAPDGTPIAGGDSIAVGFKDNPNGPPQLATDGYLTAIVYRHVSSGPNYSDASGVKAMLIAPDGTKRSVQVDDGGSVDSLGEVTVAHTGQHFVFGWEHTGLHLSTLSNGIASDAPLSLGNNATDLAAIKDVNGATFAWIDPDDAHAVTTRHLDPAGKLLDPIVQTIIATGSKSETRLASNGADRVVSWCVSQVGSHATKLLADGKSADPDGYLVGSGPCSRAIAPSATGFSHFRTNGELVRFSADGATSETTYVPDSKANVQSKPVAAFDGQSHLVVWLDTRAGANGIYGARIGAKGDVLDAPAIAISGGAASDKYDVAGGPSGFIVAWGTTESVKFVRLAPSGALMDATPITITSDGDVSSVSVGADPQGFLIGWLSHEGTSVELHGAHVPGAGNPGTLKGAPLLGPKGTEPAGVWAIAHDSAAYQVVWAHGTTQELFSMKVSSLGVPTGTKQVLGAKGTPRLACGSVCLAVWTATGVDRGMRIAPDGSLMDPSNGFLVNPGPVKGVASVAWNGSSFLVATEYTFETRGVRVSPGGSVLDAQPFNVAPFMGDLVAHGVSGAPGRWLVVTDDLDNQIGTARAVYRTLSDSCEGAANATPCDDGNACTHGDICASGICKGTTYTCPTSNPCLTGRCTGDGACESIPNQDACDDGDECTSNDRCSAGTCAGVFYSCDTGNACAVGAGCDGKGGCVYGSDGTTCDDGVPCSNADTCKKGVCIGELDWECQVPGSGATATGGASATGGAGGSSGTGTGAAAGTGTGAAAGTSGSAGAAAKSSGDDGGCGCRSAQQSTNVSWLLILALFGFFRRRSSPSPSASTSA